MFSNPLNKQLYKKQEEMAKIQREIQLLRGQSQSIQQHRQFFLYDDELISYQIDQNQNQIIKIKTNSQEIDNNQVRMEELKEENEGLSRELKEVKKMMRIVVSNHQELIDFIKKIDHIQLPIEIQKQNQKMQAYLTNLMESEVTRYKIISVEVIKEIIVQTQVEVQVQVPIEVIKQISIEVIKEVPVQVIKEVYIQVIKEVPHQVIKEVYVQVIKEVPHQVIKEIYIIKQVEVPVVIQKIIYAQKQYNYSLEQDINPVYNHYFGEQGSQDLSKMERESNETFQYIHHAYSPPIQPENYPSSIDHPQFLQKFRIDSQSNTEFSQLRSQNESLKSQLLELKQILKNNHSVSIKKEQDTVSIDIFRKMEQEQQSIINELQHERHLVLRHNEEINKYKANLREISHSNKQFSNQILSLQAQKQELLRQKKQFSKEIENSYQQKIQKINKKYQQGLQQLKSQREELLLDRQQSNNIKSIMKRQINNLTERIDEMIKTISEYEQIESLIFSKLDQNESPSEVSLLRLVDYKCEQLVSLKEEVMFYHEERIKLFQEMQNMKRIYEIQIGVNEENNVIINRLNKQLDKTKNKRQQNINYKNQQKKQDNKRQVDIEQKQKYPARGEKQAPSKGFSQYNHKIKLLSNHNNRNGLISNIKRLLKHIDNIQLQNKITALVQQLYLDADYRQRTNLQMQQIINRYQKQILSLQSFTFSNNVHQKDTNSDSHTFQKQQLKHKKMLMESDNQKLKLIFELNQIKNQNHHIRLQLEQSNIDDQTENLIQQLTLQLEQQKYTKQMVEQQNQELKEELYELQVELSEKNNKIKIFTLQYNLEHHQ